METSVEADEDLSAVLAANKENTCSQSSQRHRFKVVKLVSSEPYLRGRWNCKDFKDGDCALECAPTAAPAPQTAEPAPNGVAIDNKIEQAMDLVKSHLMFAVREEVDVLKERIKELESEIHILRAHASTDVLALVLREQSGQMSPQNE